MADRTLAQIIDLFWEARIMESWRQRRGNMFIVRPPASLADYAAFLYADETMEPTRPKEYHFKFEGTRFGGEHGGQTWCAVTYEGVIIVGPFFVPDGHPENVPYFPEEWACSRFL